MEIERIAKERSCFRGFVISYVAGMRASPRIQISEAYSEEEANFLSMQLELALKGSFLEVDLFRETNNNDDRCQRVWVCPVNGGYKTFVCSLWRRTYPVVELIGLELPPLSAWRMQARASNPYERLSSREKQVCTLLLEGRSNRDIAQALYMSPNTADRHRTSILRKLNIHSVYELIHLSYKIGLPLEDSTEMF